MNRLTSLLILAATLLGVLAGCSQEPAAETPANNPGTPAEKPKSAGGVEKPNVEAPPLKVEEGK